MINIEALLLEGLIVSENQPEPADVSSSATPRLLNIENAEEFIHKTIAPKTIFAVDNILDVPFSEFPSGSEKDPSTLCDMRELGPQLTTGVAPHQIPSLAGRKPTNTCSLFGSPTQNVTDVA
ncbi:hypothetical protein N7453_004456 [Penicillium expansum]|nr:hypothetical protein N7453_004456 [Penicillium expansum]